MLSEILCYLYKLAQYSPNKEICGLVDSEGNIYPITNVSKIPSDFVLSRQGYGEALKAIKDKNCTVEFVYHSHLNGDPTPSKNDLVSLNLCKHDYLIVANNKYTYTRYNNE